MEQEIGIQCGCRCCGVWLVCLGRQAVQFLRGLFGGDGLSSMLICQRDSLRFVLRACGRQVGMTDRAGYHQYSSGISNMAKIRGPSTEPWGTPVAGGALQKCEQARIL